MATYNTLKDVREKLAALSVATAAAEARMTVARLHAIERGDAASVVELEHLAPVYGLQSEDLMDDPIQVRDNDGISVLTSVTEFRDVTELTRARIIKAANAARDLVSLRKLTGDQGQGRAVPSLVPPAQLEPFQEGAWLAGRLRTLLQLGTQAIPSMRDFMGQFFPDVGVLYADLGPDGPAGLGFADDVRGPAVVLNLRGKNENALVRRFSLAHELCHLVADWNRTTPLASVSGFLGENVRPMEQRANAFAVRLLCPEAVVRLLDRGRDVDAARVLMEEHGLHYGAARLYLENETTHRLPVARPPFELQGVVAPHPRWEEAERPRGVEDFPVAGVVYERRGVLAHAASTAYARGLIPRDAFARFLGVTPADALENVLGLFGLDPPADAGVAGA